VVLFIAARRRQAGWGAPEKQSGMEMRNQSAMSEKKAPSGMAPLLPVCTSNTFSPLIAASVIPGKYAAQRQATPVQPSYERWIMPQSHTLPKPAPTASSRYTTSSAVSSAPREAGDRNPAQGVKLSLRRHPRETAGAQYRALQASLPKHAPAARSRYTTSSAVSSAPCKHLVTGTLHRVWTVSAQHVSYAYPVISASLSLPYT